MTIKGRLAGPHRHFSTTCHFPRGAGAKTVLDLIIQADKRHISAANVLETGIVLKRGEAKQRVASSLLLLCVRQGHGRSHLVQGR